MQSCFYEGTVRHRRYAPVERGFSYRVFMVYLDLAELPQLFDGRWLWSARGWAPARFRREDHLGDPRQPLSDSVRSLVAAEGVDGAGPIRLLTHLRYFGYCFNPVSFYYCFNADGSETQAIVADVSNTPWADRHAYVITAPEKVLPNRSWRCAFRKEMHVSPFMDMEMEYRCVLGHPGETLVIHMENWQNGSRILDATLTLRRRAMTAGALRWQLLRFPFMTQMVIAAIYWQALLIRLRGVAYRPHPRYRGDL